MFKLIFNVLLVATCFFSVSAQQFLPTYRLDSTMNHAIGITGYGQVGLSAIQNKMARKFVVGGSISQELIAEQLNNHKGTNRVGLNVLGEIEYRNYQFFKRKLSHFGWSVKAGQQLVMGTNYQKDIFSLLFQGNENADNLNLSNAYLSAHYFSKIGIGIFSKKSNSSVHLNLIGAHAFTDFYTRSASYSNTENNNLNFSMDGALTTANLATVIKGWGLGIDAAFYVPFGLDKDRFKGIFSLKVNNLGAVYFNQSENRMVDTTVNYSGFSFSQLNGLSAFDQQKLEDTLGVRVDTSSTLTLLPSFIQIGKEVDLSDKTKFQSFFGARLMPTVAFVPQVYAGVHWRISPQFSSGAQLMYGGFSNLKVGMYSSYSKKSVRLSLGTEDVIGVLTKQGRGASAVIRAIWSF